MSMTPESQDFEQLRRLFAIKRHEQPPPGYYDRFSRDVMARIKSGDTGDETPAGNWIQRLWATLEAKPMFAGAFGAGVCAVLISGLLNAEDSGAGTFNPVLSRTGGSYTPSVAANEGNSLPAEPSLPPADTASLNSLFDFNPGAANVQSANWAVPGN